ncbi:MAG: FixJ family two-component response regulator, partial [Oleiphilaceae bacterium]
MSKFSSLFLDETNDSSESNEELEISQEKYRILIVDDEENIRKALRRVFRRENYEIITAETAGKALLILGETPCQLMITDYKMPGITGADLLREVKALYPETIRILLTGQADSDAVMAAIKDGAVYKFILKPWNDDDLRITVALGLEQYDLKKENDLLKKTNKKNSEELNMLAKLAVSHRSQLAIMLNKKGLLNDQQVQKLYQQQQVKKQSTLSIITDHGWLTEEKIHSILTKDFLFEKIDLRQFQINEAIYSLIPSSFCRKQFVFPLRKEGKRLIIAMADPMDQGLIEELKFTVGLDLQAVIASSKDILQKIAEIHGDDSPSFKDLETSFGTNDPLDQIEIVIDEEDDIGIEELLRGTDEPPAIRLVNAIMME